MATGGPAKTAAMLKRVSEQMSDSERRLYGERFAKFSEAMNVMQSSGISAVEAASRLIKIAEQVPAPARSRIGDDAEELYQMVKSSTDEELDAFRRKMFALDD